MTAASTTALILEKLAKSEAFQVPAAAKPFYDAIDQLKAEWKSIKHLRSSAANQRRKHIKEIEIPILRACANRQPGWEKTIFADSALDQIFNDPVRRKVSCKPFRVPMRLK